MEVIFFSVASLCISIALFFTLSYTVISATLLGFFSMIFLQNQTKRKLLLFIFFCCFGLLLFLFFSSSSEKFSSILRQDNRSSLTSRIMIWKASSLMIANHPFFGIGAGNFQTTYLDYQRYFSPYLEWAVPHPHNLFFSFWLQTGIFGLIGFLWLLFVWFKINLSKLTLQKKQKGTFHIQGLFISLMIIFLLIGLFDTPYWKNDLAYSFWLLFALGLY
jgi:O-antigen ligase